MQKSKVLITIFAATIAITNAVQAQPVEESVDMSAFTCEQLLAGTADSLLTGVWLSGYYNGLRKNTKLVVGKLQHNSELVAKECTAHPKQTVMQTIEMVMPSMK